MTDERVETAALFRTATRLPQGSGIILRHYSLDDAQRRVLFERLKAIAQRRCLVLLVAGDMAQAVSWGADGWHGDRGRGTQGLIHSSAVHNMRELRAAARNRADFIFLSPLFATRSHPGAPVLGVYRFASLAGQASMPVMALGGIGKRHIHLIRALGATGYGAIDALSGKRVK